MATIYLDDKAVNGKKGVCEYLKIDPNSIPSNRRKEFEVTGGRVDRDGNLRVRKSIDGKPEYSVYVPHLGREVKVRYAVSQSPVREGGFRYTGKTLMEPAEDGSVLMKDENEFIFWFIRPLNRQSPFRREGAKFYYEYKDNDAKAKSEIELEEARIDALSIIVGSDSWSMAQLRQLAKGMNISGVDDMTDLVVKKNLKDRAYKDPLEFYKTANSREVIFSGKIQEAIDLKVLHVVDKNGMRRWYLNDEEILPIQYGDDPLNALKNHLSSEWYKYADEVNRGLEGRTVASNLNNPANDEFFEEAPKVSQKAEMNVSFIEALNELKKDEIKFEKIKKLAEADIEDPSLHWATRKSYNENKELIDAYKASLEQ